MMSQSGGLSTKPRRDKGEQPRGHPLPPEPHINMHTGQRGNQYLPQRHLTPEQKDTAALSYVNRFLVPSGEPSEAKRKREEEGDSQVQRPNAPRPATVETNLVEMGLLCHGLADFVST